MKKIISMILAVSLLMSVVPEFSINASAASVSYYETTKDKVPLRDSIGEEKPIIARIAKKRYGYKSPERRKKLDQSVLLYDLVQNQDCPRSYQ